MIENLGRRKTKKKKKSKQSRYALKQQNAVKSDICSLLDLPDLANDFPKLSMKSTNSTLENK